MPNLAERLKELRLLHSKTQSDIAGVLNMSRANYGFYEAGKQHPPIDKLIILAEFFQVSVDYLVGYSDTLVVDVLETVERVLALIKSNNAVLNGQELTPAATAQIY